MHLIKTAIKLICVLILFSSLVPSIGSCAELTPYKHGFYFERYDLSSPEKLISLIKKSFEKNDFLTIWLCLDYRARVDFMNGFQFGPTQLFSEKYKPDMSNLANDPIYQEVPAFTGETLEAMQMPNTSLNLVFIQIQMAAIKHGVAIYRMEPKVKITRSEQLTDTYAILWFSDGFAAKVTRNHQGQWRLYQIYNRNKPEYSFPVRDVKSIMSNPMYKPIESTQ